ncbi:MAG: FAD-binding domain-containing protein [Pirellulales bacterium]
MHDLPPDASLTQLLVAERPALAAALARRFPDAAAGPGRAAWQRVEARGGRNAASERLARIDPVAYERSRNHVGGSVTGLSPWIRHGVVSLAEVRDAAIAHVAEPEQAAKLVAELGWRDYWRQVQAVLGDRIHDDIEPAAAPRWRRPRLDRMPDDVLAADTGMRCIDDFVARLHAHGWLHNHERMWLASWLVHVRGVRWQIGADWFLEHLLDGDPASNHLSWQWIAGTFAAKPYLFNRENLERFTAGAHCRECPVLGRCDIEGSYEELAERLFVGPGEPAPPRIRPVAPEPRPTPSARPLVWITIDAVAATSPAAAACPESPRLFVVDDRWLATERPALKRLVFLFECLADVPGLEVLAGDPAELLPRFAAAHGCDGVALAETTCPRTRSVAEALRGSLPVATLPWPTFCDRSRVSDLGRFSRYWQKAGASALRPTPR